MDGAQITAGFLGLNLFENCDQSSMGISLEFQRLLPELSIRKDNSAKYLNLIISGPFSLMNSPDDWSHDLLPDSESLKKTERIK